MRLIILFIRAFFTTLSVIYSIIKMKNHKEINNIQKLLILLVIVITSIFYAVVEKYSSLILSTLFSFFLFSILISYIIKINKLYSIVLSIFGYLTSYIGFAIATGLVYILFFPILETIVKYNLDFPIVGLFQLLSIYLFFKIKRFKYGFSFLREDSTKIDLFGIIISIVLLIIGTISGVPDSRALIATFACTLSIGGIIMFEWLRIKIRKDYIADMKDLKIQTLENIIKEKDKVIEEKDNEISAARKERHEFNHDLLALGHTLTNISSKLEIQKNSFNSEIAKEISNLIDAHTNLSDRYKSAALQKSKGAKKLKSTNVYEIDILLSYMQSKAEEHDIDFNLKINDSITYMISNLIPKEQLTTLIANHIENSIIAINHSKNTYKSILVLLGLLDKSYQLIIHDSGIEFEIDTLINLGSIPITTHKDSGGTGTGFSLIFKILKDCMATLIIEERRPDTNAYTKSIIIRFDNKNEYIIKSYRADEISKHNKNERIILENI